MLIDTSAWIEYLRSTGSPANIAVREALATGAPIVTCDAVVMEVLAGGRSESHTGELRRLLARGRHVHTEPGDWESAAQLYRTARRSGLTVRRLIDCLIAAVALRIGEPILHNDVDFESIAQVAPLSVTRG